MRVLVTGASGMLGGATADLLAERGHDVTVLQRRASGGPHREVRGDVADPDAAARAAAGQDAVVHLAAKVDVVGDWEEFARTNIEGTRVLLEAARTAGARRFVHVSSPSVAHAGHSLVGAPAGPADPVAARGDYARSKAVAELLALGADGPGDDFRTTAVRPHLVWGPGDAQLVGRIVARARAGRLPLLGRGTALIDTTVVDNAAAALVRALERIRHVRGRALVVTNGEPRPVGELLADICRAAGAPTPRWHVPARVGWLAGAVVEGVMAVDGALPGPRRLTDPPLTRFLAEQLSTAHWFDQRQTRELLDWRPQVSIEAGLARLAAARDGQYRGTHHIVP